MHYFNEVQNKKEGAAELFCNKTIKSVNKFLRFNLNRIHCT